MQYTLVARGLLLALAALAFASAAPAVEAPRLGVALVVKPATRAGGYVVSAEVRNLANDEVIAAPTLQLKADEPARVLSKLDNGDELRMTVTVASAGEVDYKVELHRSGQVVTSQSAQVKVGG